jgi:hypothetical protein
MKNGLNFFNIIFKGKRLMQGLESPLQPKGLRFKPFLELFFHSRMKWMKANSQGKKGFKLLLGNNRVPKGSKA